MTQDTLSQVLRSVRLQGAVFYCVEADGSWVAEQPRARDISGMIMPGAEHVMMYHALIEGSCWCSLCDDKPVLVGAGDVVVFPRGDPHVLSSAPRMRGSVDLSAYAMPLPEQMPFFLTRRGESVAHSQLSSGGGDTVFMCGYFGCDATPFNPLLGCLPAMLHISAKPDREDCIGQFVRLALIESRAKRPGGEAVLERLSETMFVEVIRRYLDTLPEAKPDWLSGLRDRHVGRALALIHAEPNAPWTTQELAQRVGISRSVLHDRFLQFTGQAPIQYVTSWRIQLACGLLKHSSTSVAAIALEVGYESEAAFSRAFRRAVGVPPGSWRRGQGREQTGSFGSPQNAARAAAI